MHATTVRALFHSIDFPDMITTYRSPALLLVLASLAAAGCGTPAVRTASDREAEAILARLRQSYATVPMLTLKGELRITGAPVTIIYEALVRSRDSLRIDLTGPFAIPVGALSATQDGFLFFNGQEGEAIEGRPDRETFGKLMGLNLDYDEMVSMLRGELPRFPDAGTYTAEWSGDEVTYSVTRPGMAELFTVDTADVAVLRYSRSRIEGELPTEEFAITYDLFSRLGGRAFPRKVNVDIEGGERRVTVSVERMQDAIDTQRSCALTLPGGIERRRM